MIRELPICSSKAVISEIWALFLFFKTFFTGKKDMRERHELELSLFDAVQVS